MESGKNKGQPPPGPSPNETRHGHCRRHTLHLVALDAYFTCMVDRPFWRQRIEDAWREAPIVWLCGVRRSGKTTLAQSLGTDRILYVNCDLPSVEDMVRDPA